LGISGKSRVWAVMGRVRQVIRKAEGRR